MRKKATELPSNRLRELSKNAGLKPYDLAHRYRVDQSTIYRWESGRTPIPDDIKLDLAELFGVAAAYLMGWDEEPIAA